MNRVLKKIKFSVLALVSVLIFATGCGKSDGDGSLTGDLTRAQYIGMLGDTFGYQNYVADSDIFSDVTSSDPYYAEIQSSAEWGIIDTSNSSFSPDSKAQLSFAIESAVKAIGVSDISASGAAIDESDLISFYTANIAGIDVSNPNGNVSAEVAKQIIDYAVAYRNQLELPQITEMEFADNVVMADPGIRLNADGESGILIDADSYNVGDIVYFDNTENSLARAVKITEIDGDTFKFEDAAPEEVYTTLRVSGTFEGQIVSVTSASDGTKAGYATDLYNEINSYEISTGSEDYEFVQLANGVEAKMNGKDQCFFKASFDAEYTDDNGLSANGHGDFYIGIKNISVTLDYDHAAFNPFDPKSVTARLNFDTEVSSHLDGAVSKSIPLGEVEVVIWGPINLRLALVANVGADGSIDVVYTTRNCFSAGWKKGTGLQQSFTSDSSLDMQAQVTLTAEATLRADFRVGAWKLQETIVNAQITSGVVAHAEVEADILSDEPVCADILLYVPLKFGINQEACLLTKISDKLKYSKTIWDSTNSPVQLHFHFEDGVRTAGDECTRGKGEEVVQEPTTEEGAPLDDENGFEFEMLEFDFIKLDSNVMFVSSDGSMNIGFVSIPDGYSESELIYTVEDSGVCSASGGTVKASAPGSTIVRISTPDGMFTTSLAVIVNEDYSTDFEAL